MPTRLRHGYHPSTLSFVFVVVLAVLLAASGFVAMGVFELVGLGYNGASGSVPVAGPPF